jgi:hypothetical protein
MNPTSRIKKVLALLAVVAFATVAAGCTNNDKTQQAAQVVADNHTPYVTKNDIEFKNYNARQIIADDPTTILWCTAAFPGTGLPMFTVPIVGKLTSSGKRPYAQSTTSDTLGPDGMYGTSVEYRYGFTPAGVYVDFTGLPTYCSTEPSTWQKDSTKIVLGTDPALLAAQKAAQAALAKGDTAGANKILQDAILAAGGN